MGEWAQAEVRWAETPVGWSRPLGGGGISAVMLSHFTAAVASLAGLNRIFIISPHACRDMQSLNCKGLRFERRLEAGLPGPLVSMILGERVVVRRGAEEAGAGGFHALQQPLQ